MKKRIRFLMNTLTGGGAERVLVDLLHAIPLDQYEVELVVVSGGAFSHEVPSGIRYKEIVKCKSQKLKNFFEKIVYKMPANLFRFLFLRGKFDAEIAYMQGFPTRMIGKCKTGSCKTFAFVHNDFSVSFSVKNLYKSKNECLEEYRDFSKVCFVSQKALEGFEKTLGQLENSYVVHNVLDISSIISKSEEENEFNYQTTGKKLVTVGRLVHQKNYTRLITICGKLEKEFDFELWIIGEGEERAKLEELIEKNQIKSVHLLGFQSNPYSFMQKADLFVCSSLYEGYSTVITEALILGLPAITTDCAGMDELLDGGKCGLIVENSDDALEKGLADLLKDESLYKHYKQETAKKSRLLVQRKQLGDYENLFAEI